MRRGWIGVACLLAGCAGSVRRINPDLRPGPRAPAADGFQLVCTFAPGARRSPVAARRLCEARRAERVTAQRTEDGGLRIRIRFADARSHRLELYLTPSGGRVLRGAVLIQRRRGQEPVETEPQRGWIAVDHLDVGRRSAAGRYALTFGGIRVGGSFVVNRDAAAEPAPGGATHTSRTPTGLPQRARRP